MLDDFAGVYEWYLKNLMVARPATDVTRTRVDDTLFIEVPFKNVEKMRLNACVEKRGDRRWNPVLYVYDADQCILKMNVDKDFQVKEIYSKPGMLMVESVFNFPISKAYSVPVYKED